MKQNKLVIMKHLKANNINKKNSSSKKINMPFFFVNFIKSTNFFLEG